MVHDDEEVLVHDDEEKEVLVHNVEEEVLVQVGKMEEVDDVLDVVVCLVVVHSTA